MIIENDVITKWINDHSHDGDPDDPEARLVYSQIRNEPILTEDQPSVIITTAIQSEINC